MNSKLVLIILLLLPFSAFSKFKLTYEKPTDHKYQLIYQFLDDNPTVLGDIVERLNNQYAITDQIKIVVTACGLANSRYSVFESKIYICYETIWAKISTLTAVDANFGSYRSLAHGVQFTLLHEVGHVIVHQLKLTEEGNKTAHENLADEFAMISLLEKDMFNLYEAAWVNASYFEHRSSKGKRSLPDYEANRHQKLFELIYGFATKPSLDLKKKAMHYDLEKLKCEKFYRARNQFWQNNLRKISKSNTL